MTGKKKSSASSESSSETTSGSSSSSSSSSGSDSSSSSDSESSSSQESIKNSEPETQKKTAPIQKSPRKSSDSSKPSNASKNEPKASVKTKTAPLKQLGKSTAQKALPDYSTDDDDKQVVKQVKRKSNVKPKVSATITPKPSTALSQKTIAKNIAGKNGQGSKGQVKNVASKETKSKANQKNVSASKVSDPKKKSIFSPENSSDSEAGKPVSKAQQVKTTSQSKSKPEPRPKAAAKPVEKSKNEKKVVEKKVPEKESSASSATSTSASASSSSDSESSEESSEKEERKIVKKPVKKPVAVTKENAVGSDSETEPNKSQQVTRKLTRSASTRKSKHVLGKSVYSDTDSDTESTKRSLSRSPVKRAPGVTKGKTKNNKKNDTKSKVVDNVIVERKCPLEGCDSMGHLSGKFDKHFTLEACPLYHNFTISQCKQELTERKKREEIRKKASEHYIKSPKQATVEQKLYLARIKDLRIKFKMEPMEDIKPQIDKNKEPDLNNFVPEYDLKLFRDAQAMASEKIEEDLKSLPSTKGTKYIEMGKFEMEVWYQSPYPEDYARLPKLYICEFCLRYMKSRTILERHVMKCVWRHPPGEEVYRKEKVSVWEVDGKKYKQYCQNLCLLAKFFLDHKTLYYDVEPFLFYVMTLVDGEGCHTVGYFSKEKNSFLNYNVSCILTLPPYQRQGYGRLLIDFSYLLTRVEGKIGSPEKPLSDLGLISYRSYWKDVLLNYLCSRAGTTLSVKDISQEMAIHSYDIVSTLQALGMMKYWKGKHIILKKQDVLDEYVERVKRRGSLLKEVDPSCLKWTPPQSQASV
ncbi:histone acetyltransferase KAT7 [Sitophilus oryzae]|uniref:Histone acetyltransferase n=1 Tax=Sitophilus oryzae TaxID=7048 RepID=A0A6J2XJH0_SITOR|nr:histone acetyltransferase KAT7 [Sitophilus oryzae]